MGTKSSCDIGGEEAHAQSLKVGAQRPSPGTSKHAKKHTVVHQQNTTQQSYGPTLNCITFYLTVINIQTNISHTPEVNFRTKKPLEVRF